MFEVKSGSRTRMIGRLSHVRFEALKITFTFYFLCSLYLNVPHKAPKNRMNITLNWILREDGEISVKLKQMIHPYFSFQMVAFGGAFKHCARSRHKTLASNITDVASKIIFQVKIQVKIFCHQSHHIILPSYIFIIYFAIIYFAIIFCHQRTK